MQALLRRKEDIPRRVLSGDPRLQNKLELGKIFGIRGQSKPAECRWKICESTIGDCAACLEEETYKMRSSRI